MNFPQAQTITRSADSPNVSGYSADFTNTRSPLIVQFGSAGILLGTKFSYSAWIKPNTTWIWDSGVYGHIVYLDGGIGIGYGFAARLAMMNDGKAYCSIGNTNQSDTGSVTVIPVGKWTHVLCNYDGTNLSTYVDGKLSNTKLYGVGVLSAAYIGIGNGANSTYRAFNGLIDDVVVYSQSLTSEQIQKIYAEGLKDHYVALK